MWVTLTGYVRDGSGRHAPGTELEVTELQKLLLAYQYAETEVTSEIRKRILG